MSTNEEIMTAALKKTLGVPEKPTDSGNSAKKSNASRNQRKKKNASAKRGKQSQSQSANQDSKAANKKKESSQSNKKKGNKGKQGKPQTENYAWSAFQASPDASSLPIPAFVSPTTEKPSVDPSDTDKLAALLLGNVNLEGGASGNKEAAAIPPPPANLPRAEDLEAAVIAEAERQRSLKLSSEPEEVNGTEAEGTTKEPKGNDQEASVESGSGVNLAQLAASPPKTTPNLPPQRNAPVPPPPSIPVSPQHPPNGLPGLQQPLHNMPQPHHLPYPTQFAAPPGYIMVQVQVPPQLLPGRRMVVASPAGYPVQIVVPEGVPPGAVIPVHVPAIPPQPYSGYGMHPFPQNPHPSVPPHHQGPPAY